MVGKSLLGKPGFEPLELNDDFVNVNEVYPHLLSDAGKNNICLVHKDNSDFNLRINFSKSSVNNKLTIGRKSRLKGVANFNGCENDFIFVGDSVSDFYMVQNVNNNNNLLFVGARSSSNGTTFSLAGNCEIVVGENAMFANDVFLRASDMHSILDLDSCCVINESATHVTLFPNVWLGQDSIILKGVTIGPGSIVAARAVVTSNFSANVLIGGIPAKTLKKRVFWTRQLNPTKEQATVTKEEISHFVEQYSSMIENVNNKEI